MKILAQQIAEVARELEALTEDDDCDVHEGVEQEAEDLGTTSDIVCSEGGGSSATG